MEKEDVLPRGCWLMEGVPVSYSLQGLSLDSYGLYLKILMVKGTRGRL
jgi:hypothetical protein